MSAPLSKMNFSDLDELIDYRHAPASGYHLYRDDLPVREKLLAAKMVNGYFVILSGRIPNVLSGGYRTELLMVNGPYKYAEDAEDDLDRLAQYVDQDVVDIECYWCGPDDEKWLVGPA